MAEAELYDFGDKRSTPCIKLLTDAKDIASAIEAIRVFSDEKQLIYIDEGDGHLYIENRDERWIALITPEVLMEAISKQNWVQTN